MPSPSEQLPDLEPEQRAALSEVGRQWGDGIDDPRTWHEALPVDPSLDA
ncbi:hypothetical protein [Catenulispora sp. GP43]